MATSKSGGSANSGGRIHIVWGAFFALSGLCIALIVLFFADAQHPSGGATTPPGRLAKLALDLASVFGMTLFTMGVVTILLETKSWKTYFERGLNNVVSGHDYLTKLGEEQLKTLQLNSLKAFYRGENVEREGSFLIYCTENIHQYVSSPYREDVHYEIIVEDFDPSSGITKVYEKLRYVCRKGGEHIQEDVTWTPDPGEYLEHPAPECSLTLKYPEKHDQSGKDMEGYPKKLDPPKYSYNLKAKDLQSMDGLMVVLEARYSVQMSQLQTWQMKYPTRNFTLSIKYPEILAVQLKEFVTYPDRVNKTQQEGYFSLTYNTWLLPLQNGAAWNFVP